MELQLELLVTATTTLFLFCGIKFRWFYPDNHPPPPFTVANEGGSYCAVCLNDVISGDKCRKLPKCGHVFHVDCVDAWLKGHWTCPLCRRQVTDHLPAQLKHTGNSILSSYLVSRVDDFITSKIYDPITQTVAMFLFKGVVFGHP